MSPFLLPFAPKLVSKSTVYPSQKSSLQNLKLSVSDLPMLSCQYIQKGVFLTLPPFSSLSLVILLKAALSQTLVQFPPLAGRLTTDSAGHVFISCNDAGVEFIHADAGKLTLSDVLPPTDVPSSVKEFFAFALDGVVSYRGHSQPLLVVQVTELADAIFIGCAVNHAVTDGTSFWNFFNSFAEVCKVIGSGGAATKRISRQPDFSRNFFGDSTAVLKFPPGGPKVTFSGGPLRERIFRFSRKSILHLKSRANGQITTYDGKDNNATAAEIMGKQSNDNWTVKIVNRVDRTVEISSFQSLCAQLWRSVTRARKLAVTADTTFRMAVNCRHRVEPRVDPLYFGNAIQSIPTVASVGEILSRDLRWCAELLHKNVVGHGNATVRRGVNDWERDPRCFPLGNSDGASITMGSSPRFPMYDNDFGWGRPVAVRSGRSNKFDGKISAFPGREGGGNVDLEVCLAPDTMSGLEADMEFMQYVTE